jgi:hypothetical protein
MRRVLVALAATAALPCGIPSAGSPSGGRHDPGETLHDRQELARLLREPAERPEPFKWSVSASRIAGPVHWLRFKGDWTCEPGIRSMPISVRFTVAYYDIFGIRGRTWERSVTVDAPPGAPRAFRTPRPYRLNRLKTTSLPLIVPSPKRSVLAVVSAEGCPGQVAIILFASRLRHLVLYWPPYQPHWVGFTSGP